MRRKVGAKHRYCMVASSLAARLSLSPRKIEKRIFFSFGGGGGGGEEREGLAARLGSIMTAMQLMSIISEG